jgi:hypothetical protein
VNKTDPRKAEAETRINNGKKKLFLTTLTGLFSESIVFQAFAGSWRIFIRLEMKNL